MKHGFGIIGCGMIAEFHARAIAEVPGASLAAVMSRSPANGAKIAALADGGPCPIYPTTDALLADPAVSVVCVCTPSGAHLEPAVAAARAGRHVVVEKPLEITLARCDAIIRACDEAGVRLGAIFPSRFSPANLALKGAIDTGRFGRLTLADTAVKWWRSQEYYDSGQWRGTWNLDGGGALMNQAIHNVDLIQWLMGDVASVQALTGTLAHERIEVEDVAVALLRFRSGALGTIQASTAAWPGLLKRTEVHGTTGSARVEQDDITFWSFRDPLPDDADRLQPTGSAPGGAGDPKAISHAGHRDQLADFLQAIDEGRPALVDGREGRRAVEIIRAVYRSNREDRPVALPLVNDGDLGPP